MDSNGVALPIPNEGRTENVHYRVQATLAIRITHAVLSETYKASL